jgi:hypothetical protein
MACFNIHLEIFLEDQRKTTKYIRIANLQTDPNLRLPECEAGDLTTT